MGEKHKRFGELIQRHRERRGLTRRQLGIIIGVEAPEEFITLVEAGRVSPRDFLFTHARAMCIVPAKELIESATKDYREALERELLPDTVETTLGE